MFRLLPRNCVSFGPLAAEFGDQRDHAGVDADYQPIGFFALLVAHQQPAGVAGQIGHTGTSLVEDQVQAGAQPIPALLERRDAGVISWAMVPAECASCRSWTLEQTTAFNSIRAVDRWAPLAEQPAETYGFVALTPLGDELCKMLTLAVVDDGQLEVAGRKFTASGG